MQLSGLLQYHVFMNFTNSRTPSNQSLFQISFQPTSWPHVCCTSLNYFCSLKNKILTLIKITALPYFLFSVLKSPFKLSKVLNFFTQMFCHTSVTSFTLWLVRCINKKVNTKQNKQTSPIVTETVLGRYSSHKIELRHSGIFFIFINTFITLLLVNILLYYITLNMYFHARLFFSISWVKCLYYNDISD